MNYSPRRRTMLLAAAALPLMGACSTPPRQGRDDSAAEAQLAQLERTLDGRLGVFVLDTADGAHLGFRANERFPFCSTFKVIVASAILDRSARVPGLLRQRVRYAQSELVTYSPVTEKHVADGMTVAELCAAGIQYSDNTSANLLVKMLGGPEGVTAFARAVGDGAFRLDRWETELNSALPGDPRDTTTPEAMARSLQALALGNALQAPSRALLQDWMRGNTTGAARIRAGVPADWRVGDKTGTGDYGSANDIAVLWPPNRAPVVVAIYTTRHQQDAGARGDVVAAAARIAAGWVG